VFASGSLSWSVTVPDGDLDYVSIGGRRHVSGTWKGNAVDITR
jgi:hypothetical protein